jgi:MFS family permease
METTARRILRGNVLWLSVVSLLNDTASEMIYPLLPSFLLTTLGATPAFLGVIEGVAESTASLLKLATGWVSDRARRRKPFVFWGYTVATVARPLIAIATAPWHILAIRFADRMGKGARSAPRDALLAASIEPEFRGRAFGLHQAADHAGAVLGPLLAALLLYLLPGRFRLVFALAVLPGIVSLFVIAFRVQEHAAPAAPAAPTTAPAAARAPRRNIFEAFRDPVLLRYLFVLMIFTLGNATDAFLLLRARDLGVALAALPLLWCVHNVSKMVFNVIGGGLSDRFGPRRAIIAGWLFYAATYAGFAYATSQWQIWGLFLFYGLFYGLTEAPEKALVTSLAPADRRGSAFGAYHFSIGIAALPASVIFGVLWTRYGAFTAFITGAALALAAAIALPFALRGVSPDSSVGGSGGASGGIPIPVAPVVA